MNEESIVIIQWNNSEHFGKQIKTVWEQAAVSYTKLVVKSRKSQLKKKKKTLPQFYKQDTTKDLLVQAKLIF